MRMWTWVVVAALAVWRLPDARADDDDGLADHPFLSGSLGMGLTYTGSSGSEEGHGSFFGRADIQALSPVWLSLRVRVAPITQVDTLVGYRISHDVGMQDEIHYTPVSETSTTRTYAVTAHPLLSRSDVVVVAGFKSTSAIMPLKVNGVAPAREVDAFSILTAGVQWQTATVQGSHRTVELYGLYNRSESSGGAIALWHNSINNHVVFGMEVGVVPASTGTYFFWSLVDIGYGFEL